MLFGKKDKNKPNERVLDLKARVDALRAADDAHRKKTYSLDHFLEGDDVLTGREVEDDYKPSGFDPEAPRQDADPAASNSYEANLQAELDKYIRRQEELEHTAEGQTAPQPRKREPEPENASFLLDGTWSRDDAPPRPTGRATADATDPWPVRDATGSSPTATPSDVAEAAPYDGSGSGWPDSSEWPAEEEWPPREEAV